MITCVYEKGRSRITLNGHAEYAEYGKDIVCATATALMYTLAAMCERILDKNGQADRLSAEFKSGRICVAYRGKSKRIAAAFKQTALGLEIIEKNFPKFLRIVRKP